MTDGLTFDAGTHTYRLGGRRLPGITEVLRAAGLLDELASIPEEYRERGARIHRAIMYDIQGDLGDCDPADLPYVEAARRAIRELDFRVLHVEELCCDSVLGIATHIDARGVIGWTGQAAIVNWKSSASVYPAYAIQMAGEALACCGGDAKIVRRIGIHLHDDGTYAIRSYTDRNDFDVFVAALRVWLFKENNR